MTKKLISSLAAATALLATPVLAQATDSIRAPASTERDTEQMEGNGAGIIIAILAAAAVIAGIIVAFDDDDVDLPTSP